MNLYPIAGRMVNLEQVQWVQDRGTTIELQLQLGVHTAAAGRDDLDTLRQKLGLPKVVTKNG
jgi:hypothetical protein